MLLEIFQLFATCKMKWTHLICQITGRRRRSANLLQGGLEVPCSLTFIGTDKEVSKAKPILHAVVEPPSKKVKLDDSSTSATCVEDCDAVWLKFNGHILTEQAIK